MEKQRERLVELFRFARSINSERVELQKDEYLFLLEFLESYKSKKWWRIK